VAGFTLYIHPSSGPITPLEIDLTPIELVGETSPRNSTAAMARALAAQIEKRLEQSRAREVVPAFERVIPYINPLLETYVSGIVVRVPGVINDEGNSSGTSVEERIAGIEQLHKERLEIVQNQTRSQLFEMQMKLHEAQNQAQSLQQQLQVWRVEQQQQLQSVERQRLQDTEEKLEEAKNEFAAERQEKARIGLQLELAQQRIGNLEAELDNLGDDLDSAREEATTARMDREPLLKTIEEQKKVIAELHKAANPSPVISPIPHFGLDF
jgi:hypothetical protein